MSRSTLPGFWAVYVDIVTVPHDQPIRFRRGILRRARMKSTTVPMSFTAESPRTMWVRLRIFRHFLRACGFPIAAQIEKVNVVAARGDVVHPRHSAEL